MVLNAASYAVKAPKKQIIPRPVGLSQVHNRQLYERALISRFNSLELAVIHSNLAARNTQ